MADIVGFSAIIRYNGVYDGILALHNGPSSAIGNTEHKLLHLQDTFVYVLFSFWKSQKQL